MGHWGHEPEIWLSEDDLIATFFLNLPETIGWPKGLPIRKLVKIGPRLHRNLKSGEAAHEAEGQSNVEEFENLAKAHVLASSIILHQVPIDLGEVLGFNAAMTALRIGVPLRESGASDEPSIEAQPGTLEGCATIAEVAIPLQMLAALSATENLVEGFVMPSPKTARESVDVAIDAAIEAVREFQATYHSMTRRRVTAITRELMPPLVPYTIRTRLQIVERDPGEEALVLVNSNIEHVTEAPVPEPEEIDGLFRAGSRDPAIRAYLDLHQQATSAMGRGNTRETVVMLAAASEALLNIVLCHMRWEELLTPEDSAIDWPPGLTARVRTEFSGRLGGDWNLKGNGPVARWAKDVAEVRNRVVHGGYLPSRDEAELSVRSLEGLLSFIGDRLVHGQNLIQYPRTASEILSESGLRRRDRYPKWLERLQEDPFETVWNESFKKWYTTHLRLLGDELRPRAAEESRSELLCVHTSPDVFFWALRDPLTQQAAKAEVILPPRNDPAINFRRVQELSEVYGEVDFPISVSYVIVEDMAIRRVGPWVEQYHLCPLMGVMMDGSDFVVSWPLTSR